MNVILRHCTSRLMNMRCQKSFKLNRFVFNQSFFSHSANIEHLQRSPSVSLVKAKSVFRCLTTSRNRCWKCSAIVTERDLVCLSCGCVQEPRELNNFELFKENPQFDIDVRNLTVKFRRLQTLLHPDKFATGTDQEQKYSLEQSSRVNRAYQTLLYPLDRAMYLLELHQKPLLEGDVTMSPEFLTDILEINEQIDTLTSADAVESMRHVNNAKLEVLFGELSQSFKEKNIDKAREITAKLKYFITIDGRLKKIEEEMGISRED